MKSDKGKTTGGKPFSIRLPDPLLKKLAAWRRRQPDIPNRSEAIRRLIEQALSKKQS